MQTWSPLETQWQFCLRADRLRRWIATSFAPGSTVAIVAHGTLFKVSPCARMRRQQLACVRARVCACVRLGDSLCLPVVCVVVVRDWPCVLFRTRTRQAMFPGERAMKNCEFRSFLLNPFDGSFCTAPDVAHRLSALTVAAMMENASKAVAAQKR